MQQKSLRVYHELMCVETVKNALKYSDLGSIEKVSKLALSTKNVKEKLEFAKIHKK
jgi:hypothetical protein